MAAKDIDFFGYKRQAVLDAPVDFTPVMEDVLGFCEDALTTAQDSQTKIAALEQEILAFKTAQDKVVLEKVASAKASFFDASTLNLTLKQLVSMDVLDSSAIEKVATMVRKDPNALCHFIIKMANHLMSAPGEGESIPRSEVERAEDNDADTDPDGWNAFAQGKAVKIRK